MKTNTQLKALLSIYDDDATIEFIFREPVGNGTIVFSGNGKIIVK